MDGDMLCLKSNDHQLNSDSIFKKLRTDSDFTDVTLVCEDGDKIEAHKYILSAFSPIFQKMLQQSKHTHPMIYLRGLKNATLTSLLDFIYNGEAYINQENVDNFLTIGQDLQLLGLSQKVTNNPIFSPEIQTCSTPKNLKKISGQREEKNQKDSIEHTNNKVEIEDISEELNVSAESISLLQESADEDFRTSNSSQLETNKWINDSIESMIEQVDTYWRCKTCGKISQTKSRLKQHMERHVGGIQYPCNLCEKTFKSRPCYYMHKSRVHKKQIGEINQAKTKPKAEKNYTESLGVNITHQ